MIVCGAAWLVANVVERRADQAKSYTESCTTAIMEELGRLRREMEALRKAPPS